MIDPPGGDGDNRRSGLGDVFSLPNRLWRSITGDFWTSSSLSSSSSSLSSLHVDNVRRYCVRREWECAQRRRGDGLTTSTTNLTKLDADEVVSSLGTVTDLDQGAIDRTTTTIERYRSELINLERLVDLRRHHLVEGDRRLHQLTADLARLSPASDGDVDRSERSDLQRQIGDVEGEMDQLRNGIDALRLQMDAIRDSCDRVIRKRDELESSLDLALVKVDLRRRQGQHAHGQHDDTGALPSVLAVGDDPGLRSLSAPTLARQDDQSTGRVYKSITLLGEDDDVDRPGTITIMPIVIRFDPTDGAQGTTIPMSDVVSLSADDSILSVGVVAPTAVRFRGEAAVVAVVADFIRRIMARGNRDPTVLPVETPPPSPATMATVGSSDILSPALLRALIGRTPPRNQFGNWRRLYALRQDGMSLGSMSATPGLLIIIVIVVGVVVIILVVVIISPYRAVADSRLNLLLIEDDAQGVFGAYLSEAMQIHPRYFGSGETFVFQLRDQRIEAGGSGRRRSGELKVYPWSGANACLVLCRPGSVSVGGGTHFAVFLAADLRTGSSGASDTFASPRLSAAPDFAIANLEVWGR